jgi:hypothetical protein
MSGTAGPLNGVIESLRLIEKTLEDLWIERNVLSETLKGCGYTEEQLTAIREAARGVQQFRHDARAAFAGILEGLEKATTLATAEALLEQQVVGKPN